MPEILIIDDDPTTCLVLKRNLERQGYVIRTCGNGEEGLVLARQLKPALIICDWGMPGMDGLQVCRIIKSEPQFSTTFFILLTARTEVEDRVKGLDAGSDEFLSKPIDPNELQARVRAGLRLHQLSEDLVQQARILQAELARAADYVKSILPVPQKYVITPDRQDQIIVDWLFAPSQELGGDSFDYFWLDQDHLAIYLLDVSGHGVGAALLSVSLMNMLRSQSLQGVDPRKPEQVLAALNNNFQMAYQNDIYFTIWYGIYHAPSRTLTYSSGGHPPALLISCTGSPSIVRLKTPNVPIGIMPDVSFNWDTYQLSEAADLYVFSDGCYEVPSPEGELWGIDALATILEKVTRNHQPGKPIKLEGLLRVLQRFSGQTLLDDDSSLLRVNFDLKSDLVSPSLLASPSLA